MRAQHPSLRFHHLLQLVAKSPYQNAEQLAEKLHVNVRTVRRDLKVLQDDFKAPIKYEREGRGWILTEPSYSLPSHFLTKSELESLQLGRLALDQNPSNPLRNELAQGLGRVTEVLPSATQKVMESMEDRVSFHATYVPIDSPDVLERLRVAIEEQFQVRIEYWAASTEETLARLVDPYHLTSRNNAWYLIGYCHVRRAERLFSVQRIRSLEVMDERFSLPIGFQPPNILADAFLAISEPDAEVVCVRVRADASVAKYIRERVWHQTQIIRQDTLGGITIEFRLRSLIEIVRWVLSWGDGIEVLEPVELRELVCRHARALVERHAMSACQPQRNYQKRKGRKPR